MTGRWAVVADRWHTRHRRLRRHRRAARPHRRAHRRQGQRVDHRTARAVAGRGHRGPSARHPRCPGPPWPQTRPRVGRGAHKLLSGRERLDPAAFARLWNSLVDAGDPGIEVLHAYTVKENLRQLLGWAGTDPHRALIRDQLWRLYDQGAASPSPEVHRFAGTVEAWWPAITTGYSSARSEGYNRLAKHQARNAFGFRNVDNHRRRVRGNCTRQRRRAPAVLSEMPVKFDDPLSQRLLRTLLLDIPVVQCVGTGKPAQRNGTDPSAAPLQRTS